MKKVIIIGIIVISLVVVLGAAAVVLKHVPAETYAVEETDSQAHWGTITGSLGYPSESIPPMGVCAEAVEGIDQYCTYKIIEGERFTYGYGYELTVPPDDYYVFAHLITKGNEQIGYTDEDKAYYSDFVACGLSVECSSHEPIAVSIGRNDNAQGIDPIDWYVQ